MKSYSEFINDKQGNYIIEASMQSKNKRDAKKYGVNIKNPTPKPSTAVITPPPSGGTNDSSSGATVVSNPTPQPTQQKTEDSNVVISKSIKIGSFSSKIDGSYKTSIDPSTDFGVSNAVQQTGTTSATEEKPVQNVQVTEETK